MSTKMRVIFSALLLATLLLAGCGGEAPAPAAEPTAAAVLAEATARAPSQPLPPQPPADTPAAEAAQLPRLHRLPST